MKTSKNILDVAQKKIEIRENKILLFIQKFWDFSNFYGEYRASIHFDSNKKSRDTIEN